MMHKEEESQEAKLDVRVPICDSLWEKLQFTEDQLCLHFALFSSHLVNLSQECPFALSF